MSQLISCLEPASIPAALATTAQAVSSGELVVLPTDTLYGIGADAFNNQAVANLLAAKHRGSDYPVPVLVGSWDTIQGLVAHYTPQMRALVEGCWPGGLSMVVQQAPSLPWNLGDTRGTVMLRMPNHPVAIELLRKTGPMAVSSANIHGHDPATTVEAARQQLGESASVYLDGGEAEIGTPSTIVDLSGAAPKILRDGAVSRERIAEVLDIPVETLEGA